MKYKELAKLLSVKDLLKLCFLSSLGLYLIYFIMGSLMVFFGENSPVTLGDKEVGGIKGFLTLLAFSPFYILFFTITQFLLLGIGLWISRQFLKLRKES